MAAKAKKASKSLNVANEILTDLGGAGYYADKSELAGYLTGRLGTTVITAARIAEGVIDDHNGAKIMDTAEEVAAFIEKQIARPDLPEPGSKVE